MRASDRINNFFSEELLDDEDFFETVGQLSVDTPNLEERTVPDLPRILDIEEVLSLYKKDNSYVLPSSALFRGAEYSLSQICFFSWPGKYDLIKAMAKGPAPREIVVNYAWNGRRLVAGVEGSGSIRYVRGVAYRETSPNGESLDSVHRENLRGIREEIYHYSFYAGRLFFLSCNQKELGVPSVDQWIDDVRIILNQVPYADGMKENVDLEHLVPVRELEGSYIDSKMYETPDYSRWSEKYHGPTADEIVRQWQGRIVAPADGAGLITVRAPDRTVSGDLNVGSWTHRQVVKETIGETLDRTKEGDLQVFFFCAAFMTDQDYAKVRHPFVFVDKYRPGISTPHEGPFWWGSVPFSLTLRENIIYSNPSYSKNLIMLGKVSYVSENLHSRFSRELGLTSSGGVPVSQTWKDFLSDHTRYFALVGMIPIVRDWKDLEVKYSRVVYHSTYLPASGVSSCYDKGIYYFYFPNSVVLNSVSFVHVKNFPTLTPEEAVGNSQEDFSFPDFVWPHINFCLERSGLYYMRIYLDFRREATLIPYLSHLESGVSLPPSVAREHSKLLVRRGKLYYFRQDLVLTETVWHYPSRRYNEFHFRYDQDPIEYLEGRYWSKAWLDEETGDYIVGDESYIPGIYYGQRNLDEEAEYDMYGRAFRIY